MGKINKAFLYAYKRPRVLLTYVWRKMSPILPARLYLKVMYRLRMGYWMDLNNPVTFNEKLQWLKLNDHNPDYIKMVDKYEVKDYVANILGREYIIPTLGVWDRVEDIEWDKLPNQFVLKCTHDSGGLVICKDKARLDIETAKKKLRKSLSTNYYNEGKEWPYKHVKRRIIAEQYIEPRPDVKDLPDYKFFCFNGEVKGLYVATDRQKEGEDLKMDFYDAEFNHLPMRQSHGNANVPPKKPKNFEIMKRAAEQLSQGIHHVRVDFYEIEEGVLFGEMTFFSFSGMLSFQPDEWDKRFGEMLTLPGEKRGGVIIRISADGSLSYTKPDLYDYKFFCFNGEVKFFKVDYGRYVDHHANYYSPQGDFLAFGEKCYPFDENADIYLPSNLREMVQLAQRIAEGHSFVRVDLYNNNGKILFGEITFFPFSGFGEFNPKEYDQKIGGLFQVCI